MKKAVLIQMFLTILFFINLTNTSVAQKLICRQNGGAPTFHTQLDEAILQASNGDTLYIPGGYFALTVAIDKEVHLIGEGHNPKSSLVNGVTYIGSTFQLLEGASHSSFHGLHIEPFVYLTTGVNFLLFTRCSISNVGWYSSPTVHKYIVFSEDIFREGVINCPLIYSDFNNCIFQGYIVHQMTSCTFKNNIFLTKEYPLTTGPNGYGYINFSRFENNIFLTSSEIHSTVSTDFFNNLFAGTPTFDGVSLKGFNNITGQSPATIFLNQTGNTFLYEHDYKLKSEGVNKGTDGNDIGIYGGPSPWKDGSVPFNPHVELKTIDKYTDTMGNLKVQIKVSAQDR